MSNDELKQLPSMQGYVNLEELQSTLLHALGTGSFSALGFTILAVLLENAQKIYVGPSAAIVIAICSSAAALIRARSVGMKYLQSGE
jgi:hypothetical protein